MLYNERHEFRVHVKIYPKASVLNMNCCRARTDRQLTENI